MILATLQLLLALALGPALTADGVWPLHPRPEVAEGFAPPAERWGAGHRGVDLRGRPGQEVRAAREGRVTFAGTLAGRGVVVVSHGETRTTYEPVAASVRVNEVVDAGEPIGRLQTFGSHCWPRTCLHWGLVEGERYLDPLTLVGGGPVRLLPLFSAGGAWGETLDPPTPWLDRPRPGGELAGRPGGVGLW